MYVKIGGVLEPFVAFELFGEDVVREVGEGVGAGDGK